MDERRRHVRFSAPTIVQYKDGVFSAHMDTVTRDVSLGGVSLFTEKKLPVNKVIKLRLFYDSKTPAKDVKGMVVWTVEHTDKLSKGYMCGVKFLR